ncbi:transposase [Paenibacillus sp. URB8-2]|uniref:transposase n=1 Tax=Paenibacillus sp. URB8-2 TaxID=2741301 RepID=UPI0015C1F4FC|nr:transposase [Paenibacillus sp. URB8-2]BCG61250.1 hypothetical protein PUR_46750 [Paenibacillus sp. URB8-2]
MLDVHYPDAPKIKLIMDNLNTHSIASLYQAFDPETALRLAKRLEIHYTPKRGSNPVTKAKGVWIGNLRPMMLALN